MSSRQGAPGRKSVRKKRSMNMYVVEHANPELAYVSGVAGQPIMADVGDVLRVIEYCWEVQIDRLLLYAENLPEQFFDLSSQQAGLILQKFRNYQMQVAIVMNRETRPPSRYFEEAVREENRHGACYITDNQEQAEAWLVRL